MRSIPEGTRVRFYHERVTSDTGAIQPRGGKTKVKLTLRNGVEVFAEANCSKRDNYSKRIGRDIALGRALKSLDIA